jgi:hypothetical protein
MISAAKPPLSPTCSTGSHERSEPAHHLRASLVNIVATEPDQARRLSHGGADRRWRGSTADAIRPRLDRQYPSTAAALTKLKVRSSYLDGELCGVRPDGVTSFELMHQASDGGGAGLTYFVFDLLELDGEDLMGLPLIDCKRRLAVVLKTSPPGVMFNDHETGDGEAFRRAACKHGLEGTVSKRADRPYLPDDRGAWVKTKCKKRLLAASCRFAKLLNLLTPSPAVRQVTSSKNG